MKKYTLLWHVFELEPRAHDFLDRYVQRIEIYANTNNLNKDIQDDIKYNIIEKLYTASSPINEAFVMNLAETIGEPEQIFENKSEINKDIVWTKNILGKWLWRDKPMLWWVSYRISKSLNIPVSIIRLIFLIAVFIYGTGLRLYVVLALFVPFKDKKSTTGLTGNLFFEIVRVIIWLGVICFLWTVIISSLVGLTMFAGLPTLSNQSIQDIIPTYLYPLAWLSILSLIILLIGSLWALIKKLRVSQTIALISIVVIISSLSIAGITGFSLASTYNYNPITTQTTIIETFTTDEDTIIINLSSNGNILKWNYFNNIFGWDFWDLAIFQEIELLPSTGNDIIIEVVDNVNILPSNNIEHILSQRSQVSTISSGNTIDIMIPDNIFINKVPFSFAERTINIYIPTDKKVIYNNNSTLRYGTPSVRNEYTDDKYYPTTRVYCNNKSSFTFYPQFNEWRCSDTEKNPININNSNNKNESFADSHEKDLESMFIGLTLSEAQSLADINNLVIRVVEENGIDLQRTEDYRPGRINLELRNWVIVDLDVE